MGKHPRSTCITWSIAEVLGLVWLSLKGVCVLCFSALSACKGWGHVVAPVRPGSSFLTFLKQLGSLFGAFWHHFGRLGLPVATFQAHLAPESHKLENYAKVDSKMGAFLGPFWVPCTLGLHKGAPWSKNGAKSCSKLRFVDFVKMSVFRR